MNTLRLFVFSSLSLLAGTGCVGSPDGGTGGEGGSNAQPEESALTYGPKCVSSKDAGLGKSPWVYVDANGKLAYKTLPRGERILDFSYAGYRGGGVAIPDAPVKRTVKHSGGDQTAEIQQAIDEVAADNAKHHDLGAVLLTPGEYRVSKELVINGSGVVLRGSGSGKTTLVLTGSPRTAVTIHGAGSWRPHGASARVTDAYVPSGTRSFRVDDPSRLHVGDAVLVEHEVSAAWVRFMGMDHLVRNGEPQTWIKPGSVIEADRTITAISGHQVTVDAPLPDSYDAKFTQVTVTPYTFAGRIHDVGIEGLHLVAPQHSVPIDQPHFSALEMDAVSDAWVRDVVTDEFLFGITTDDSAKSITIEDTAVRSTMKVDGSHGWPFSYKIGSELTLVQRSEAAARDTFAYATQARQSGPNVALFLTAKGGSQSLQPHQRWATGLLLDNIDAPGNSIDLIDRGIDGSGHGWTIGYGVVWNGLADSLVVEQPPGAENWVIGARGKAESGTERGSGLKLPNGIFDSLGKPVAPQSLYLAQLCERLGPKALSNVGY